ncbi:RLA class II histocompatibility antigen, DP alpha-1 chain-like isoform X1 [Betta splendens]|uniref:RLA class II histocompatibility antigen, DP alpha-1 chain-like isoform X1 n=1 Tax=Betta splendens TaxID=158456 RepID=A0A6P7LHX2_BETSP|nr:RLA class II histocompatibility antigen, DP alpha-1 chain-like isoform X1 [Betta splendens]
MLLLIRVMKMKVSELFLVLSWFWSNFFCFPAEFLHSDFAVNGCSDTDGELVYGLDDEDTWYADFVNGRGVEPQPSFMDHISHTGDMYQQALEGQRICKRNLGLRRQAMKDIPLKNGEENQMILCLSSLSFSFCIRFVGWTSFFSDPPSNLMIYTRDDLQLGDMNTLICYATGFYPAPVKVHWTKNGQNVTDGPVANVPHLNKDGSFKQIFRLQFIPQQGDVYTCTAQHPGLDQPLTSIWEVDVQQPSVGPAVFCALGLTVALLGVAAGTFFLIKGNSEAD